MQELPEVLAQALLGPALALAGIFRITLVFALLFARTTTRILLAGLVLAAQVFATREALRQPQATPGEGREDAEGHL